MGVVRTALAILLTACVAVSVGAGDAVCAAPDTGISQSLRTLLSENSVDNHVLVMMTNEGYLDFTSNYICSLRKLKLKKHLVIATDENAFKFLRKHKVPTYFNATLTGQINKGSVNLMDDQEQFITIMLAKLNMMYTLISSGFHIILSDVDVYWQKDAFADLVNQPEDMLFLWDGPNQDFLPDQANAGFVRMLSNERTKAFMLRLIQSVKERESPARWDIPWQNMTDQHYFNKWLADSDRPKASFRVLENEGFISGWQLKSAMNADLNAGTFHKFEPKKAKLVNLNWAHDKETKVGWMKDQCWWMCTCPMMKSFCDTRKFYKDYAGKCNLKKAKKKVSI